MSDRGPDGTESSDLLWYESLSDDQSWVSLWTGYVRCGCGGICSTEEQCPVCGKCFSSAKVGHIRAES